MTHITYRELSEIADLEQVVSLEIDVWGSDPRDAVPTSLMRAVSLHGGVVTGAYDGDRLVGLGFAFPARRHGKWILWSHNAGVHPDYQSQGVGFGIKQAQRTWALSEGFREIGWTFDPLQRGNANFNLHRLGATTSIYRRDYYGIMQDAVNAPIPSDRVEARWALTDRRVSKLAQGGKPSPLVKAFEPEHFLLLADMRGWPAPADVPALPAPWAFAAIPRNLKELDTTAIEAWRMALRQTLESAFAAGYVAADFVDQETVGVYVLKAPTHWSLYVLQCADNSLYTGISPDVDQRIKTHNAGRGAAYTSTRRPVTLLGAWEFETRSEALKAEIAFKRLTRAQKFAHLNHGDSFQGGEFRPVLSHNA